MYVQRNTDNSHQEFVCFVLISSDIVRQTTHSFRQMSYRYKDNNNYDFKKQMFQKRNHLLFKYYKNLFCSISFGGKRILRLSESKEKVFSLPNVSKMPKGNVTKERRRRRIFAKLLIIPLNSREWRPPQTRAAKPRVLNASFKEVLNAHLRSRCCRFSEKL